MKNARRSSQSIYLSKEIYEAFAQCVKDRNLKLYVILEQFMEAYVKTYSQKPVYENSIQYINAPLSLAQPTLSPKEKAVIAENIKNTMLEHVDFILCSACGEMRPIAKHVKEFYEREGLRPKCQICNELAEVVERCP